MVMSSECEGGAASPGLAREREGRERVTDREKELAGEASQAFTKGDYTGCLTALEKLEVGGEAFNSNNCVWPDPATYGLCARPQQDRDSVPGCGRAAGGAVRGGAAAGGAGQVGRCFSGWILEFHPERVWKFFNLVVHLLNSFLVVSYCVRTLGLNLAGPRCEDDVEGSVLVYNLAVAKFQQRHMLQVRQEV